MVVAEESSDSEEEDTEEEDTEDDTDTDGDEPEEAAYGANNDSQQPLEASAAGTQPTRWTGPFPSHRPPQPPAPGQGMAHMQPGMAPMQPGQGVSIQPGQGIGSSTLSQATMSASGMVRHPLPGGSAPQEPVSVSGATQ